MRMCDRVRVGAFCWSGDGNWARGDSVGVIKFNENDPRSMFN